VPVSDKSRLDALKQFADMQQKYGALLQNKTPDIQEANLGEKGTYHRLMVGPPGSREGASELCTQIKAQGYPSCWVTAY
jgi:cell division septation protein DedD